MPSFSGRIVPECVIGLEKKKGQYVMYCPLFLFIAVEIQVDVQGFVMVIHFVTAVVGFFIL